MVKQKTDLQLFINKVIGILLILSGTTIFYEGFHQIVLSRINADPTIQLITGTFFLVVAYLIFDRKVSFMK